VNEAEAIIFGLKVWGTIGAVAALVFLIIGIDRIDEDAKGAYIFRLLLVPGVIMIWPLVLWRWYVLETGGDGWFKRHMPVRNAHRPTAFVLAAVVVLAVIVGLTIKQNPLTDFVPQKLALSELNAA
jgi:uncharacterized membrane protein